MRHTFLYDNLMYAEAPNVAYAGVYPVVLIAKVILGAVAALLGWRLGSWQDWGDFRQR